MTKLWRRAMPAGLLLLAGGCATTPASTGGAVDASPPRATAQKAAPVSGGYRYALIDSGALPPGELGLGDQDMHFYPYVAALPFGARRGNLNDDRWVNQGSIWVQQGGAYGSGVVLYPSPSSRSSGSISRSTSSGSTATAAPSPSRAPTVRNEPRRPTASPTVRRPAKPGQVENSRR